MKGCCCAQYGSGALHRLGLTQKRRRGEGETGFRFYQNNAKHCRLSVLLYTILCVCMCVVRRFWICEVIGEKEWSLDEKDEGRKIWCLSSCRVFQLGSLFHHKRSCTAWATDKSLRVCDQDIFSLIYISWPSLSASGVEAFEKLLSELIQKHISLERNHTVVVIDHTGQPRKHSDMNESLHASQPLWTSSPPILHQDHNYLLTFLIESTLPCVGSPLSAVHRG